MARDIGIPTAAFVAVTALAALLGAENLGEAATFGQLAFMLAVSAVIVRG